MAENISFKVKFCPSCGESLTRHNSFINEFWVASDTVYFCWCSQCYWRGEIVEVIRITAPELASDE
jgi:hypothetical protein